MSKIQGCSFQTNYCWMENLVLFKPENKCFPLFFNYNATVASNALTLLISIQYYLQKALTIDISIQTFSTGHLNDVWRLVQNDATNFAHLDLGIFCSKEVTSGQVASGQPFSGLLRCSIRLKLRVWRGHSRTLRFVLQPLLCCLGCVLSH